MLLVDGAPTPGVLRFLTEPPQVFDAFLGAQRAPG